jgi:hypothetical protein
VQFDTVNTHRQDGHEIDQSTGIAHYGFSVDKLTDVLDLLGGEVQQGETPQNGRPAEMRIVDLWGNRVDISSRGFLGREERRTPAIRYAAIECTEPEAACGFYKTNFGLSLQAETDDGVLMTDGYITMDLTRRRTLAKGGIQYFGIQVDDWDGLRERLSELGQELPPEGDGPVMLTDPEGNPYAVSKRGWA